MQYNSSGLYCDLNWKCLPSCLVLQAEAASDISALRQSDLALALFVTEYLPKGSRQKRITHVLREVVGVHWPKCDHIYMKLRV